MSEPHLSGGNEPGPVFLDLPDRGGLNEVGSEVSDPGTAAIPFVVGQDRDADDDGNFDFTVTNYIDYISFVVNPDEQVWYPGFQSLGNPFGDVPDAFTRLSNNNNPFDGSAFFWGEGFRPGRIDELSGTTKCQLPGGRSADSGSSKPPVGEESFKGAHPDDRSGWACNPSLLQVVPTPGRASFPGPFR